MKIFTSYFARLKKLEALGLFPIAICQYPPSFYTGAVYKKVAPSWKLIQGMKDPKRREAAAEEYLRLIGKLDKESVVRELEFLSNGKDIVLLCFEKTGDFCHRHLLAEWLGLDPDSIEVRF